MTTAAPAGKGRSVDAPTKELHRSYLRQMLLIRRFEEKTGEAYSLGKIGGFCPKAYCPNPSDRKIRCQLEFQN